MPSAVVKNYLLSFIIDIFMQQSIRYFHASNFNQNQTKNCLKISQFFDFIIFLNPNPMLVRLLFRLPVVLNVPWQTGMQDNDCVGNMAHLTLRILHSPPFPGVVEDLKELSPVNR